MSDPLADDYATWDEITPRSKGGLKFKANQALAHAGCNREKSDKLPTEKQLDHLRAMRRAVQAV